MFNVILANDADKGSGRDAVTLCMLPNLMESGCYKVTPGQHPAEAVQAFCGTSGSAKVVRVVHDRADTTPCRDGQTTLSYPEPPTAFCLTAKN